MRLENIDISVRIAMIDVGYHSHNHNHKDAVRFHRSVVSAFISGGLLMSSEALGKGPNRYCTSSYRFVRICCDISLQWECNHLYHETYGNQLVGGLRPVA